MITIVGQKATSSLVVSLTHLILALGTTAPFVCLTLALVSLPQVPLDVVPINISFTTYFWARMGLHNVAFIFICLVII